jgi:hypothetical protein
MRWVVPMGLARIGASACALATGACTLALAASACSLDWSTPGRPAPDAASDASEADATTEAAAPDGGAADGASCAALRAALATARTNAQACSAGPNQCTVKIVDECGCGRFANGGTPTTSWTAAITALANAGCAPVCVGSCPFVPVTGLCLASDASPLACSP